MSPEQIAAERNRFAAWAKTTVAMEGYASAISEAAWTAWQASRAATIEDCARMCEGLGDYGPIPSRIRALAAKEPT